MNYIYTDASVDENMNIATYAFVTITDKKILKSGVIKLPVYRSIKAELLAIKMAFQNYLYVSKEPVNIITDNRDVLDIINKVPNPYHHNADKKSTHDLLNSCKGRKVTFELLEDKNNSYHKVCHYNALNELRNERARLELGIEI